MIHISMLNSGSSHLYYIPSKCLPHISYKLVDTDFYNWSIHRNLCYSHHHILHLIQLTYPRIWGNIDNPKFLDKNFGCTSDIDPGGNLSIQLDRIPCINNIHQMECHFHHHITQFLELLSHHHILANTYYIY